MTKFINALQTKDIFTTNGMPTNSASGSKVLDLFYKQGGGRALSDTELQSAFAEAYGENQLLAVKAAFYNRDVRGGQGERRSFRIFFRYLCEQAPEVANANIPNVPFYGRWDDLFVAVGTQVEDNALAFYAAALLAGDGLAAKWAPREGKADHELANVLRRFMQLSWQDYRKLLAGNSKTIEQLLCAKKYEEIDYSHIPSQAAFRYRKAFLKRDTARYQLYLNRLSAGDVEVKVNAKAVFPHEIVRQFMRYGSPQVAQLLEAQWKALPNFVPDGKRFLPISDVSGSMSGEPMEVSVALGLYLAERNVGPFKDALITFSANPELFVLKAKDLQSRVHQIMSAPWGMNTNVQAVFKLILDKAKAAKLAPEDMPQSLLILSDMQFDKCITGAGDSALEMMDRMYAEAGYKRPNIVFWNLRTSKGVPVKQDARGTALVSGFSPSIMKTLLSGVEVPEAPEPTPMDVLLETLNSERYERVALG
jgi:hypothetical protein